MEKRAKALKLQFQTKELANKYVKRDPAAVLTTIKNSFKIIAICPPSHCKN